MSVVLRRRCWHMMVFSKGCLHPRLGSRGIHVHQKCSRFAPEPNGGPQHHWSRPLCLALCKGYHHRRQQHIWKLAQQEHLCANYEDAERPQKLACAPCITRACGLRNAWGVAPDAGALSWYFKVDDVHGATTVEYSIKFTGAWYRCCTLY